MHQIPATSGTYPPNACATIPHDIQGLPVLYADGMRRLPWFALPPDEQAQVNADYSRRWWQQWELARQ